MNTRKTILVLFAILLVGGLAVWWYSGFTLDFMRFFAADPGVVGPVKSAPPGCYYQEVQCIQAPCDPVLVCPTKSAEPRPSAPPGCYYQEVQCIQAPCDPQLVCPSCLPRPACLDTVPSCKIAEPAEGWCPPGGGKIVSCGPETQTVKVGSSTQVSAAGGNGTYQWFAPESNPANRVSQTATFSVSYTTPGTKKVTVQSPRGDGSSNVDSVACTVVVTQ